MVDRPLIAITCGEPAGIGPEIAVEAAKTVKDEMDVLWIGDPKHLPDGTDWTVFDGSTRAQRASPLAVLPLDLETPRVPGTPDPRHAKGVIKSIETAVSLCMSRQVDGICTAPIHKAALIDGAGFEHPGHTEFLAALAGDVPVIMMLVCPELRVVPATIHIPLSDVPKALTPEVLTQTLTLTHTALIENFGIDAPRIAVAGLNPHAGEDGKMGTEEIDLIAPILDAHRRNGLTLLGPMSADTMFHPQARETYDVAVCMYHDQALIPIKTLDFSGGVNVTLGLPFIRTSPDHGTAFDIAGQGAADARSMIAALRTAADMARRTKGPAHGTN